MVGKIMRPVRRFRRSGRMADLGGQGEIVRINSFADKPMLPEEAKLELELMNKNFIMFKNADTGEVNVLYKRGDGKYGLVEPNF